MRGGEAADLLQALNTGHGGSLTTVHANNAESALSRLASCAMQGGDDLPWDVTCRGVVDGIAMVIHMTRREGRRVLKKPPLSTATRRRDESMGHTTTRPRACLRPSRARLVLLAVLAARLPQGGGGAHRPRPG